MVDLRPITQQNWEDAIKLDVKPDQRAFVPSVAVSIAKAYIQPDGVRYDPIGIYDAESEEMVGFYSFMHRPHNRRVVYISGFLIDYRYQRSGYGAAAMQKFLEKIPDDVPECEGVYLTVHPENVAAENFYSKFGFMKTGLVIDGEDAMAMTFAPASEKEVGT
ncbi:MAG: GNAT family N-acetyltransferase [Chloroflexota bacterium]